jgi:hypothetical protein
VHGLGGAWWLLAGFGEPRKIKKKYAMVRLARASDPKRTPTVLLGSTNTLNFNSLPYPKLIT